MLFRSEMGGSERDILADLLLQWEMLLDSLSHKTPGAVVLLTGKGTGWKYRKGFLPMLKGLKEGGWSIEVISWSSSCSKWLKEWISENGHFTNLHCFYISVTFLEPSEDVPEWKGCPSSSLEIWRKRAASPFAKGPLAEEEEW